MTKKYIRKCFWLTPEQAKWIKKEARKIQRSESDIVREMINEEIKNKIQDNIIYKIIRK